MSSRGFFHGKKRGSSDPLSFSPLILLLCVLQAGPLEAFPDPKSFRDWIKSAEAYYATSEERAEWEKVGTEEDARRFMAAYWARRGEKFRLEVQRRIEFADKRFSVGTLPGSRSARGRVWMILGSPNTERLERTSGRTGDIGQNPNIFERQAVVQTSWAYKAERLPPELNLPELLVRFQTDVSRGFEVIENPAAVEPYLAKAGELTVRHFSEGRSVGSLGPVAAVEPDLRTAVEPLWKSGNALAGGKFFGDLYWTAQGTPFYAFQIYLPGGEKWFAALSSVLFVGFVRDLSGTEVASYRETAALAENRSGTTVDRYFDKSLTLPNGRYTGVFALLSPDGRALLCGLQTGFELTPAPKEFHVSALHLTNNVISLATAGQASGPFLFGGGKYVPKGDARFVSSEKVGYFVVLRNPAGEPEPSATVRMTFYKDGRPFVRTPVEAAELVPIAAHAYLNANAFEVGTFPRGHYRFIALFRDAKADKDSAASKTGVSVETEFDVVP